MAIDVKSLLAGAVGAGEQAPAKPAPTQYIRELSDAIDSLLGIIAMVQEDRALDDQALAALDDLARAAEKAVQELDRVVGRLPAEEEGGEEFRPARPVLNVPVTRGTNTGAVIRARTPSFGLEE